eukprot:TRINITY_DN4633_c0_g1_i13.p2 TRINITY_DN4633_c0_g1~~TRINITY_DN4633_c0_g1_i13.p2  ORF type:complete len:149 (+),score=2.89 TRINITY_DN4633_c0_g1_i13:49-447(+)
MQFITYFNISTIFIILSTPFLLLSLQNTRILPPWKQPKNRLLISKHPLQIPEAVRIRNCSLSRLQSIYIIFATQSQRQLSMQQKTNGQDRHRANQRQIDREQNTPIGVRELNQDSWCDRKDARPSEKPGIIP